MSNKDQAPFDIPDPEAAGWKEDPDRPGYWLWDTEQPVTEAPEDGVQYGRQDASWTEIVHPTVHWSGDSNGIGTNAFRAVVGEENVEGVGLYATGMIRVWESTQNSNYLWSGYGGGSITSHIQADGDAKFAGQVDLLAVGRFGRASLGFDTNVVFGRGDNDLPTGVDLGNASYKWNNATFAGTVVAGSFELADGSPIGDLTGYAKYSDSPANFDGDLGCLRLNTDVWRNAGGQSRLVLTSGEVMPMNGDGSPGKQLNIGSSSMQFNDAYFAGTVDAAEFTVNGQPLSGGGWAVQGDSVVYSSTDDSGVYIVDEREEFMFNRANMFLVNRTEMAGGWLGAEYNALQLGLTLGQDPENPEFGVRSPIVTLHKSGLQCAIGSWQKPDTDEKLYVVGDGKFTGTVQATGFLNADGNPLMQTLTQAEYDAITPNAETVYFIV